MHVSVYWFCFSLSKRKLAYKTRSYTSKWRWDDASQAIFLLEICLILLILFNSTQLSCFWAQTKKIDIMNHSILDLRWPDVHVTSLQKQGTFFSNGVTKPRKSWGSHLIGSRGLWNTQSASWSLGTNNSNRRESSSPGPRARMTASGTWIRKIGHKTVFPVRLAGVARSGRCTHGGRCHCLCTETLGSNDDLDWIRAIAQVKNGCRLFSKQVEL